MGGGRWEPSSWATYSSTHVDSARSVDDIYRSRSINSLLDPRGVAMRESCDSADNPNSTALIVALDVTGSMDSVLEAMARTGLKSLAESVYDRKPISDPHVMFMGIGDVAAGDDAPLQITQFEADIRIAEQLTKLWLERGGGGNNYESYVLAWYFAAQHTRIDCFEKRGKKGYLFTVGDEMPTPGLSARDIEKVLGYKPQADFTAEELLTMASRQYEVYHLIVEQGSYCRGSRHDAVVDAWRKLLGQHAITLADHTKMGEVITSIIQVESGADKEAVVKSWDGSTSMVVARALDALKATTTAGSTGVVKIS